MYGEAPPGAPHPCWKYPRGPFPLSLIRALGGFPLVSWQRGGCLDRSSRALALLVRGGKESPQLSPTPRRQVICDDPARWLPPLREVPLAVPSILVHGGAGEEVVARARSYSISTRSSGAFLVLAGWHTHTSAFGGLH